MNKRMRKQEEKWKNVDKLEKREREVGRGEVKKGCGAGSGKEAVKIKLGQRKEAIQ